MIYLFTDFGSNDLYVGQLKGAILRREPSALVIDLLHDAASQDVRSAAHLLAALSSSLPDQDAVILAVVDPGVGGARRPVVMQADGRWYVGPDNGLLSIIRQRSTAWRVWEIIWRPDTLSDTFHGRDLFAPIAAMLASGTWWENALQELAGLDVELDAEDMLQVIYVDHYGNAMTGIRQGLLPRNAELAVAGNSLTYARVFSDVPVGALFWYENSIGLVEIAGNCCNAAELLTLAPGAALHVGQDVVDARN